MLKTDAECRKAADAKSCGRSDKIKAIATSASIGLSIRICHRSNPAASATVMIGCVGHFLGQIRGKAMARAYGDLVARAIREADRRFFFEDYAAQAQAVLDALTAARLTIVPLEPNAEQVEAGKKSLTYGAQRQDELLRNLYVAMIQRRPNSQRG